MALKLLINIAKKIPGPLEYSSIQASCSIEGELTAGQDPAAESARLFAQAEAAVDAQLRIAPATVQPSMAAAPTPVTSPATPVQPFQPQPGRAAANFPRPPSQPAYRSGGGGQHQRRGPAPVTDSQLRFLDRLIQQAGANIAEICAQERVGSLNDLSCKAAAELIDRLKAAVPA